MTTLQRAFITLVVAIALTPPAAGQQALQVFTVGAEFQANTYSTGLQEFPAVDIDAAGNFVVVWDGSGSGDIVGVFGQRFNSSGTAVGTEFRVNDYTTSFQDYPGIAVEADGDFAVVWRSFGEDGDSSGVYARRYASSGSPAATPFRVNSTTVGGQEEPVMASEANGDFVVVWQDDASDGSADGIFAQRYNSAGAVIGSEFQVNTNTVDRQSYPGVAIDTDGDFVVVWGDYAGVDGDIWGVFGQLYASSGNSVGTEFQVNSYTTGGQGWYQRQAVAADTDGNFVVVWGSDQITYPRTDVFGQRFNNAATKRGAEFQVNSYTTDDQGGYFGEVVGADGAGNFLAVWASDPHGLDTSSFGIFAQAHLNSGIPIGTEFLVNSYTTGAQRSAAVAANAQGDFVVVWEDGSNHDGDPPGVFGQRYVLAYERKSQAVGINGTYGTDSGEGNSTSSSDPLETTVTSPNAGTVTVTERPLNPSPPRGYTFTGQRVSINAPSATAALPLRLVFDLFINSLPTGTNPSTIVVARNGTTVPNCTGYVTTCSGGPLVANPDPCVASRCISGSNVRITVLTSAASEWDFSIPCVTGFGKAILVVKDEPGKEKLIAKLIKGPPLTQADFNDPAASGGPPYRLRVYDDADVLAGEVDVDRAGDTTCSGGASPCWTAISDKGFKYKDTDRIADGVSKILLKGGGAAKILFKAKGPTPPFPAGMPAALMSTSSATLEVHAAGGLTPTCFSATLTDIKTQEPNAFKAK